MYIWGRGFNWDWDWGNHSAEESSPPMSSVCTHADSESDLFISDQTLLHTLPINFIIVHQCILV